MSQLAARYSVFYRGVLPFNAALLAEIIGFEFGNTLGM
jgi:hypothetical protein